MCIYVCVYIYIYIYNSMGCNLFKLKKSIRFGKFVAFLSVDSFCYIPYIANSMRLRAICYTLEYLFATEYVTHRLSREMWY